MKAILFIAGGIVCAGALYAHAQDTTANPRDASKASVVQLDSEGPDATGSSMSGGPAMVHGKTRGEVHEDLVRTQQNGEAARQHESYKGH
ncbi:hypothetical protein [Paraburkholderia sp. HP33-1]|uniref:hypothetical protein n=1 Tax=Paraburkholderia sp. HP33-1 TaxID=2883243 RepID=UPI001F188154|nr:hypothetical protein [Paraburkholderia sp. HP33-1]